MNHLIAIVFLFVSVSAFAQSECENIDFEDGNTNGWTTEGNVLVVNKDQQDPYGHFPLAVSGYNSVQLGNNEEYDVSKIKRQIHVDQSTKYFIYSYSIVFLGYPHDLAEASYVRLKVTDDTGNIIPCTDLNEYAQSQSVNGFIESTEPPEPNLGTECCYPIFYKPWNVVAIDLSPYLNQTLTFELSSAWCVYAVDWGYSYVDAYCASNLVYEFTSCENGSRFIRTIEGFDTYNWSGPGIVSGQGTNQIEINQAGTYTIDIPNTNVSCSPIHLEIEATANAIPSIPEASFSVNSICVGTACTFTNTSNSTLPISYSTWIIDDSITINAYSPNYTFTTPGNHSVQLIIENEAGCSDTLYQSFFVNEEPLLDLGPDAELCPAIPTTLQSEHGGTLTWSTGEYAESIEVNDPGFYWAELNANGCKVYDTIYIDTTGAFLGQIPNVFTPDHDETNELFVIESQLSTLYDLYIQNRWGEVVFHSNDPNLHWDGKINSDEASEGVYFYQLKYQFDCMDEPLFKQGFVHVLREQH